MPPERLVHEDVVADGLTREPDNANIRHLLHSALTPGL